jgi:predicted GNAT superfamily acetyltransferase
VSEANLEIRTPQNPQEISAIATVFQQVWGSVAPLVGVELLRAIDHSGGYVAGAFDPGGNIIGASFGFLARHRNQPALHSHVTGILPGVQHSGVGRAMKNHQRSWAADNDLDWVTWTFDPLVSRNAWFNLEVLGARVAEYLVDFYGPMTDAINSQDETDRLVMAWSTSDDEHDLEFSEEDPVVHVKVPHDIVVLRRTDPAEALRWRHRVRAELGDRLANGGVVTGFTREGAYVLRGVQ